MPKLHIALMERWNGLMMPCMTLILRRLWIATGTFILGQATMTLAVSTKLKNEMRELKGVNWSEETRQFLEERVKRLKVLQKLDEITKNSRLTDWRDHEAKSKL